MDVNNSKRSEYLPQHNMTVVVEACSIMKVVYNWLYLTALVCVLICKHEVSGFFSSNITRPESGSGLRISCSLSAVSEQLSLRSNTLNSLLTRCRLDLGKCNPTFFGDWQNPVYNFGVTNGAVWVDIFSLNRTRDEGLWLCFESNNTQNNATLELIVYGSPGGVNLVTPLPPVVELAEISIMLQCKTDSCEYPEPSIMWFYQKGPNRISLSTGMIIRSNSTENCIQQELIHYSSLELPRGTNFPGNIPMTVNLLCGITHPSLNGTKFSAISNNVIFAVSLMFVNISGKKDVTQGVQANFTCITSISRPRATVKWFIGTTEITSGILTINSTDGNGSPFVESKLTINPNSLIHHGNEIFCQAFTPFNFMTSDKLVLYVKGFFSPNITRPERGSGLRISCSLSAVSVQLCHDSDTQNSLLTQCRLDLGKCNPIFLGDWQNPVYTFGVTNGAAWVDILSLNRTRDEGLWLCYESSNTQNNETLVLIVYGSPGGVSLVTPLPPVVELAEISIMLQCKTDSCEYPEPSIMWYYQKGPNPISLSTGMIRRSNSTENCIKQELIHYSSLELSRGTNFPGNIPMTVNLLCGITHPNLTGTEFSAISNNVIFAVSLMYVNISGKIYVTQGVQANFTCITSISRPRATVTWFIGTTEITSGIQTINSTDGNGSPFVESRLTINPNSLIHHGKEIFCQAFTPFDLKTSDKLVLYVKDSPHVIVESSNGSYNEKGLMIKCSAHGVPERYTFRLIHSSLYSGIMIRQLSFEYVSTGIIIYQFSSLSYMDTGIYTCSVSSGVPDYVDGSMYASVNDTIWIRDIPQLTSVDRSFYAENGHSGRLVIELLSILLDLQVTWYKHNIETLDQLQSSEKYNIILSSTSVNVDFYSVVILQPGYIATLEIKNVTKDDFGSYQVHVQNSVGQMSPLILILKATANESQDTSHNGPDGALLGSVLGSAVLVSIVVAAVGVVLYRRRNKSLGHQSGNESTIKEEHVVAQNRNRMEEYYQELEIIEGQVAENKQTRSAGSPVYETLTIDDNIRQHEYSHLKKL